MIRKKILPHQKHTSDLFFFSHSLFLFFLSSPLLPLSLLSFSHTHTLSCSLSLAHFPLSFSFSHFSFLISSLFLARPLSHSLFFLTISLSLSLIRSSSRRRDSHHHRFLRHRHHQRSGLTVAAG
ncbi:hypothetical protein RIF29_18802 [Crotalaria pallida]|uniref:Uncharacterized protein n=1 Tax=Crotalaria pallida TaxID=3830 RepID=A0AAN9F2T5_CROPI